MPVHDDLLSMSCCSWRDAISAQADGEDPGIEPRLVTAHLDRCGECRAFAASIEGSRRRLLMAPAPSMPDLSLRVARLNALADRASAWGVVRVVLVVVALEVIVLSMPALLLGEGDANVHEARHLGAFSVAYGAALLVAAIRPARARTILPVAAVLAGALFITAIVDLVNGNVPLLEETSHIPELISVVLVWLLATAPLRGRRRSQPSSASALRVVDPDDAPEQSVG
jgi:predicted anti-sigma-YlaC factor YlaD